MQQQQPAVEVKSEAKPKKQSKKEKQQLAAQEKAKAMFALLEDEPAAGVGALPAAKLVEHKKKEKKRKNEAVVEVKKEEFEPSSFVDKDGKPEYGITPMLRSEIESCKDRGRSSYTQVEFEVIPVTKPAPKRLRHNELEHAIHEEMLKKDPWYRVKVGAFVGAAAGAAAYNWAPRVLASFYV